MGGDGDNGAIYVMTEVATFTPEEISAMKETAEISSGVKVLVTFL